MIDCLVQLKALRPAQLAHVPKRQKTVSRIYGGHYSHKVVRER